MQALYGLESGSGFEEAVPKAASRTFRDSLFVSERSGLRARRRGVMFRRWRRTLC